MFFDSIGRELQPRMYAKTDIVFAQGEPATSVFYIATGRIKLFTLSASGKEAISGILGNGAFFGEGCLADQPIRVGSACALIASTIIEFDKKAMQRSLADKPVFAALFMRHLLARNTRYEGDLVDQLLNSSEKRLARILLLLADFGSDATPQETIPNISQETLAEMVGTTRSRVSFFLNRFRKLGFIDYDEQIHVYPSLLQVILRD